MRIRKMEINDYESLYSLWSKTSGMGINEVDDSFMGIEKFLKRNPNTCFVAEQNDIIVGTILGGNDGRRGYIYHTAVELDYRNRGVGRALVENLIESMRYEGIYKIALVVFEKNTEGNKFWEEIGFSKREDLIYRNISILL
jgi:ribosomal protein S18 acetylase RimI-like enzyme